MVDGHAAGQAVGTEVERGDLRLWILGALARRAPGFQGSLGDATPLAEGGLCLDSLALMDLIGEIEVTLGVPVREEEISEENLGTVARLLRFLETRGLDR